MNYNYPREVFSANNIGVVLKFTTRNGGNVIQLPMKKILYIITEANTEQYISLFP